MSKMTDIAVIGLTGQSGAGKTTVSKVFSENGFVIINADAIAREIMNKDTPCLKEVTECFGKGILKGDGELNRQKLADIVFNDDEKLKQLNAISYPYITFEILKKIKAFAQEGERFVLLDAPDFCDLIISVVATEKVRSARIAERDGLTAEQIKDRFSSQHTEKFFVNHSDFIIKNNKSLDSLVEKAQEVAEKVKEYYNNAEEAW